jgi:predicted ATPase
MNKIEEAQKILHDLGLPPQQQNKISALTLLSLAGLKKDDEWNLATRKSRTLSKDIIEFVNANYESYKPNTRESFRNIALKPFIEYNIVLLNPDDSTLKPSSSKTHYSLSDLALSTIQKFKTNDWKKAVENFKLHQFPENLPSSIILRRIIINNYKSILNDSIQLGRFNVFIGVNGCGKTNILEAIATVGAAKADDFNFEGLYGRGVRIARPNLVKSSFLNTLTIDTIEFDLEFEENEKKHDLKSTLYPENENDVYTKWSDKELYRLKSDEEISGLIERIILEFDKRGEPLIREKIFEEVQERLHLNPQQSEIERIVEILSDYAIYDLNTKSLRGITPTDSRKTPLGLNGEGLDLLIANFNVYEKDYLNKFKFFFDWLENILSDKNDKYKLQGLKPGRSTSSLYFTDKYMQKQNNTFSAENSNEGVLHVLFYLALFISNKTPEFFAIDNIETALNPRLCQGLIKELANLSKERGKQVLITTHNPAILDGLNLLDDEQRLFEVYRNSAGHTKTRRIKFKSNLSDKKFKLSEMWLKGQFGAVPQNF